MLAELNSKKCLHSSYPRGQSHTHTHTHNIWHTLCVLESYMDGVSSGQANKKLQRDLLEFVSVSVWVHVSYYSPECLTEGYIWYNRVKNCGAKSFCSNSPNEAHTSFTAAHMFKMMLYSSNNWMFYSSQGQQEATGVSTVHNHRISNHKLEISHPSTFSFFPQHRLSDNIILALHQTDTSFICSSVMASFCD